MNFIFDIGNVLLDFKPLPFLEGLFESALKCARAEHTGARVEHTGARVEHTGAHAGYTAVPLELTGDCELRRFPTYSEIIQKMNETIFQSEEWAKLDQGVIGHEEAYEIFCRREPELQAEIRHVMEKLPHMLTPIEETIAILPKIKEAGHGLYYLSNFHAQLRDYILETYSFFELFDGGVFSCDIHLNKPDAGIYQHLLEKYQLSAAECLFFDDMEENVVGADKEGIYGVLFTGVECVKSFYILTK